MANNKGSKWYICGSLIALILIIGISWGILPEVRLWSWIINLVLLIISFFFVSKGVSGYWYGLFIDPKRNKMSLSQLQMVIWTILVLSAFFTIAIANIKAKNMEDPLSIGIPEELWLLIGISTTSLVATPLILKPKADENKNPQDQTKLAATIQQLADQEGVGVDEIKRKVGAEGTLLVNKNPTDAHFSDIFTGEEVENGAYVDLGKVQMFYFTIVVVLAYAVTLGRALAGIDPIPSLPALSAGVVALLGISHAGYLINKQLQ